MSDKARLLVVPVADNAPLVAPVTVMSLAANVVGSTSKVSINPVESVAPDVPPVCSALTKVTAVGVVSSPFSSASGPVRSQPITRSNDDAKHQA